MKNNYITQGMKKERKENNYNMTSEQTKSLTLVRGLWIPAHSRYDVSSNINGFSSLGYGRVGSW